MSLPIHSGTLRAIGDRLREAFPNNPRIGEACSLVYKVWEKGQLSREELAEQVELIAEIRPDLWWELGTLARQLELPIGEGKPERPVIRILHAEGGMGR